MNSISKNIFTNKNLINNLKNLFLNNSLPNSLIFYGHKGIGKNTLAFYLIKEIYENLSIDNQSKHHINLIYNHTHPNIRYITKEYDPKKNGQSQERTMSCGGSKVKIKLQKSIPT